MNFRMGESDFLLGVVNIPHLHCSGKEVKHRVKSLNEGVKALEHERLLELPRASRLPLVCEVGGQSCLVFLKGGNG